VYGGFAKLLLVLEYWKIESACMHLQDTRLVGFKIACTMASKSLDTFTFFVIIGVLSIFTCHISSVLGSNLFVLQTTCKQTKIDALVKGILIIIFFMVVFNMHIMLLHCICVCTHFCHSCIFSVLSGAVYFKYGFPSVLVA